jgi:CDP-glucose 4,6-dehydratase
MSRWEERRVLITGATGFIGSWLTEIMLGKGAKITVLIRERDPLIASLGQLLSRIELVYGDIRDHTVIEKAVENQEVVFHLAAITQVAHAISNPTETMEVNVSGTLNVLESIRKSTASPFLVYASTDKIYGEPGYLPIDEEHPLSAKSPYDASKLAADRLTNSYVVTYGIDASISRWSNTIGGRDSNVLRAVPDFIMSVLDGRPPTIRGDGSHIRDYMYVTDAVLGIVCLAENKGLSRGEVFNFGTGVGTSVLELANMIVNLMGFEGRLKPVILGARTPGEIDRQYLSARKAEELLKWRPEVDLGSALAKTIRWYVENPWWRAVMNEYNASRDIALKRREV